MSGTEFFERHAPPIFAEHCYECHSEQEDATKGGLLLDRESGWLGGGDSGKAVVPGSLEASLLITAVIYEDPDFEMPPKYRLEEKEVALLKKWVEMGAPGPAEDMGDTAFSQLGDQEAIFKKAADHWSFQPVNAIDPPKVSNGAWNAHPIDRFIFAKLEEKGLTPSPETDARTLTRRLSYSLTGLPPRDEGDFKKSPDGLFDELLASPRFGEHIGRFWLDVARYADTAATYRADTKTPHYYPYAFTFRDYVIDSFNADKPCHQFVKEQLAADLIVSEMRAPEMAALGFLGVSPHRNMSADFVDDVIDTATRGFLGMTVSCSRCHDHKFEPIPTADYYSLYGVFSSVERPEPWDIEDFPVIDGYDPDEKLDPEQPDFNKENSGRLEFAEKVIDPKNPLTARVYVNRIWGILMGDFIVKTPSDFGLQGEAPSHPELLDYLASDFVKNGSSTKHLPSLLVLVQA